MGRLLAEEGLTTVYGGARIGLMGALAEAALKQGGKVIGVIPQALVDREIAHPDLTELYVVDSMHQRKALMAEKADGFIALPGGLGTLEEFCEILTWAQLGMHQKPCGMLNLDGYYQHLIDFFDHAVSERFFSPENRDMILIEREPEPLLHRMRDYRAAKMEKWLTRQET
jgi:hypothetical protein